MRNSQSNKLIPLVLGTCMLGLVACGNGSSSKNGGSSGNQQQENADIQQDAQGTYRVVLAPVNNSSAGGTVTVKIHGDEVIVSASVTGVDGRVSHLQHISTGKACPTASSDLNADGFVDMMEASKVSGAVLIPLDSDLNSQFDGNNYSPRANLEGAYVYRETASLARIQADLHDTDSDTTDTMMKLGAGEELNLAGRVVEIHGVAKTKVLPKTVKTAESTDAHDTLPVACGVLVRVADEASLASGSDI